MVLRPLISTKVVNCFKHSVFSKCFSLLLCRFLLQKGIWRAFRASCRDGIADSKSLDVLASPILGQLFKDVLKDQTALDNWDVSKANTLALDNLES